MAIVNVPEIFGSMVFNQQVMKKKLSSKVYKALVHTMEAGTPLDLHVANQIADAMKEWAISKGATHYTHWFQPLTGITAEKHDSFLTPAPEGKIIDKMRNDKKPNGEPVYSFATGISILFFYAFAMQCVSTLAVVYRETKSWKWTLAQLLGMSGLAYIASLFVYQILK